MEIDDNRGEISTKISWKVGFGHGHGQRGSNMKNREGSKFLNKRSTQVGGASS